MTWPGCRSVVASDNFRPGTSPSAAIAPIAKMPVAIDAAANARRGQDGGLVRTILAAAGARESPDNTGTEDSLRSDAASESGAMSRAPTRLVTLAAGVRPRSTTCAGSKSPRLIASISARVAASGATPSSLRRRSVRSFARLSAASHPLYRANSCSAIRCRSSRVGSSAIRRSAAAMAPSPSPFASAFRHSTPKTSPAAAASRSASRRRQESNSSISKVRSGRNAPRQSALAWVSASGSAERAKAMKLRASTQTN